MQDLLRRGEGVLQMMQVTGEEGVTLEDFVMHQKALFVDMVYLQQDAFDDVDSSVSLERQKLTFGQGLWDRQPQLQFQGTRMKRETTSRA